MTDESIAAVICGLQPQPNDIIGAICNAGEMPLALVESAGRVIAVDCDSRAFEGTYHNLRLLFNRRDNEFLERVSEPENAEYFRAPGRLDRIRAKLDRLELVHGDIFTNLPPDVSKVYLSNALTYGGMTGVTKGLTAIANLLPENGLAYISDGHKLFYDHCGYYYFPDGLNFAEMATIESRKKEPGWWPVVFQKQAVSMAAVMELKSRLFPYGVKQRVQCSYTGSIA